MFKIKLGPFWQPALILNDVSEKKWEYFSKTDFWAKNYPSSRTTKLDGHHSEHKSYFWIIKLRPNTWDPNYPPGVDFLDHNFLLSRNSGEELSNEVSNFILSPLDVGHWVAQT